MFFSLFFFDKYTLNLWTWYRTEPLLTFRHDGYCDFFINNLKKREANTNVSSSSV